MPHLCFSGCFLGSACLVLMKFILDSCWCQLLGQKVLTWVSFFLLGVGSSGHPLLLGRGPGDVTMWHPSATMWKEARWRYLLFTMQVCVLSQLSHVWLCDPMDCSPPGSSVHGDSPGKKTGVGCHALLQGIFPTQRLNPSLAHCRLILYYYHLEEF